MESTLKLGKRPASKDSRDLKMAKYLAADALPPIPAEFGIEGRVKSWGILGNDNAGCCVWSAAAHEHILLTSENVIGPARFTDGDVLSDYTAVTGYNPTDPSTDNGTDMHDALKYRRQTGIVDSAGTRHKLPGYVWIEPQNLDHILIATYLFGAAEIGFNFPESAMQQFNAGQPWTVVSGSPISGGHCVPVVAWRDGKLIIVSWGRLQVMAPEFFSAYNDEGVAFLSTEFLHGELSPVGINVSDLVTDLGLLIK